MLNQEQKQQFIRDGYVIVRGLLAKPIVASARHDLLKAMEVDADAPETWAGKGLSSEPVALAVTERCRTDEVETVAEDLVGPHFLRGICHSPYLEAKGAPPRIKGYIPVLNFPSPGPQEFQKPTGYHIDGMHLTTLWPQWFSLVVFAYLTDVSAYGGATAIRPGSHRQVFEHWFRTDHPGSTHPPDLDFAEPVPMVGSAGDVIFMHYLTVHSGSANHSDRIRVGLNTAIMPDPAHPYQRRHGAPQPDWTPLDVTLRTDEL